MEFGKLTDISRVNFELPEDHPETYQVLASSPQKSPEIFVGCPVWANPEWRGKIYPSNAKPTDFLAHYAQQFNCIELNLTHYRIPDLQMIEKWIRVTPVGFQFCPKFSQGISHYGQLENVQSQVINFVSVMSELNERLGMSFLQLPPHFSPQKTDILCRFLESFPKGFPLSIEFRHPDWFLPTHELIINTVFEQLRYLQIVAVITDTAGRRDVIHQRLTTKTAVVRFVGNDLHFTDYQRIDDWVARLKIWFEHGLERLYFWIHEPENHTAPDLVAYFVQRLNQVCDLAVKPPKFIPRNIQTSIF